MWCVIRDEIRRHGPLCVALVALALVAPMAFAQSDLDVTYEVTGDLVPGGTMSVAATVTNLGPAPDPEVNLSVYFIPYNAYTAVDTSSCYQDPEDAAGDDEGYFICDDWTMSATQTEGDTDPGFVYVDRNDDLVHWNDYYSVQVNFGALIPNGTATLTFTVPLVTETPAQTYLYEPDADTSVRWVDSRVTVNSPDNLAGEWINHAAMFGAIWTGDWEVTGNLQVANAPGYGALGCAEFEGFTPGNIALVDRGECYFDEKANFAEIAGAPGIIIVNNDSEQDIRLFTMAPHDIGAGITIPVTMVSTQDGITLKEAARLGPVNTTLWNPKWPGDWEFDLDIGTYSETNDPDLDNNDFDHVVTIVVGEVEEPPVASFTYDPMDPEVDEDVMFTDTSTNSPTSWAWDFGDGGTSTDQNPTHAFAAEGTYTVSLTATNDYGSDTATMDVTVTEVVVNPPPTASFTYDPMNPMPGQDVMFTDTSTDGPTSWAWDFGDGGTSTEQNPTHAFAEAGVYTVVLTATNDYGSDDYSADVTVSTEVVLDQVYVVAAAALAEGAAGSFFVTDMDINNAGATMMTYQLMFVPRGTTKQAPVVSDTFTLAAGMSVRYENVVSEVFDLDSGLGALVVMADSDAALLMSRTYNLTDNGTFGQSIPGYHTSQLNADFDPVRILFMTEDDDYRSNLGIMNATNAENFVGYELFGSDGVSLGTGGVTLPAYGNTQINQVFGDGADVEAAYINVWSETAGGLFTCYGSVLDNITSDPTTVLPQ